MTTEKTVTYEREMTMTYGDDPLSARQRDRMNTLLYSEGLCMVGDYAYRQEQGSERYGNLESTSTNSHILITVNDATDSNGQTQERDRDKVSGWKSALKALGWTWRIPDEPDGVVVYKSEDGDDNIRFRKVVTETTRTTEQSPQGYYLIIGGDYANGTVVCDASDRDWDEDQEYRPDGYTLAVFDDLGCLTFVRVQLRCGGYSAPSLTFKMWYDAEGIEKKDAIEQRLVTDPLQLMGQIQAVVERTLVFMGFNTDDPTIDCHFRCLNESKSECAPDIIAMVRAEKEKHL